MNKVVLSTYRRLVKLCGQVDKDPAVRSMVSCAPIQVYNHSINEWVPLNVGRLSAWQDSRIFVDNLIRRLNNIRQFYIPPTLYEERLIAFRLHSLRAEQQKDSRRARQAAEATARSESRASPAAASSSFPFSSASNSGSGTGSNSGAAGSEHPKNAAMTSIPIEIRPYDLLRPTLRFYFETMPFSAGQLTNAFAAVKELSYVCQVAMQTKDSLVEVPKVLQAMERPPMQRVLELQPIHHLRLIKGLTDELRQSLLSQGAQYADKLEARRKAARRKVARGSAEEVSLLEGQGSEAAELAAAAAADKVLKPARAKDPEMAEEEEEDNDGDESGDENANNSVIVLFSPGSEKTTVVNLDNAEEAATFQDLVRKVSQRTNAGSDNADENENELSKFTTVIDLRNRAETEVSRDVLEKMMNSISINIRTSNEDENEPSKPTTVIILGDTPEHEALHEIIRKMSDKTGASSNNENKNGTEDKTKSESEKADRKEGETEDREGGDAASLSHTTPHAVQLLLAHPQLGGFFRHSVMLVVRHADNESAAFVLNRRHENAEGVLMTVESTVSLSRIHAIFAKHFRQHTIMVGGPVVMGTFEDNLFLLHLIPDIPDALPIADNLWLNGDLDVLMEKLDAGEVSPESIVVLCGFSGWGVEQLRGEVESGTWVVASAPPGDSRTATMILNIARHSGSHTLSEAGDDDALERGDQKKTTRGRERLGGGNVPRSRTRLETTESWAWVYDSLGEPIASLARNQRPEDAENSDSE